MLDGNHRNHHYHYYYHLLIRNVRQCVVMYVCVAQNYMSPIDWTISLIIYPILYVQMHIMHVHLCNNIAFYVKYMAHTCFQVSIQ